MVIVLLFQEAATPAGSPLAPVVPAFAIPVAPVVVWVIFVNGLLIDNVGVDEGLPAVLAGVTVIVPVALTLPHPPVKGIV